MSAAFLSLDWLSKHPFVVPIHIEIDYREGESIWSRNGEKADQGSFMHGDTDLWSGRRRN